MRVQSLGQEDALEEKTVFLHGEFSRILQTEEPGGQQSIGSQRVGHNRSDLVLMHKYLLST